MRHISSIAFVVGLAACSASSKSESAPGVANGALSNGNQAAANDDPSFDPASRNPFVGAEFYVNPGYAGKVEGTANAHPTEASSIRKVAAYPTAVWLDSVETAKSVASTLQSATQQGSNGKPVVTVFVIYDLPNRDCSARSSGGELTVESGGEARYRTEFIDKIASHFSRFPDQRIVAIVEPDSLPNLATNMSVAKCAQSEATYRNSIAYAVSKLAMPNVTLYLDAGHAGWLGWNGNRTKIAQIFKDVLTRAGGADKIRGFATNVSNFNTLSGSEGKQLGPANPCPDELSYVTKLSEELRKVGIINKQFIIDTSRNGVPVRTSWGQWCNIKGAGLGQRPQAAPAPQIDAYFWIKPPGDSDGVSDPTQPRFDAACQSSDSSPNAPQAGQWFEAYFLQLVKNAQPAL